MRLFLSHTWTDDECGRNTHERVRQVRDALRARGMSTWFDQDHMIDNIDACMASGIESSDVFCVFLTRAYCRKVDTASKISTLRDNCYKEFSYAQTICKHTLCIVFEPSMLSIHKWPCGIVKLHLGNKLYVDGSGDDADAIADDIVQFVRRASRRDHTRAQLVPARNAPVYVPRAETGQGVVVGGEFPRTIDAPTPALPSHGGRARGHRSSERRTARFLPRLFPKRAPVNVVLEQNRHHDGVCNAGGPQHPGRENPPTRIRIL